MKQETFHRSTPTFPRPERRRSRLECFALSLLCLGASAVASEPPLLASARRALAESAPGIAIVKLKAYLRSNHLEPADRDATLLLLAEAQTDAGQSADALQTLAPLIAQGDARARFTRALALTAARRWNEALAAYREISADPGAPLAAHLGEAETLQALGRSREAVDLLERISRKAPENLAIRLRLAGLYIDLKKLKHARSILGPLHPTAPGDLQWKHYLDARVLLADGRPEDALAIFEALIGDPSHVTEGLLAAATIGAGEARAAARGYDAADKPLETFIWRHPDSRWLEVVFRRLDEIYAHQENPAESELQKWAAKQPPRCAALARYYVARMQVRQKKTDKAAWSLQVFVENYPTHPLLSAVHVMRADLLIEKSDMEAAVRALDAAERAIRSDAERAEIELRRGLVLFQQQQFLLAANEFQRAAEHSPKLRDSATYNAALAALNQQNYDRFLVDYQQLTANAPESPLRPSLILEEGLIQARHADPRAEETLQLFLNHFPQSERQSEARLALAELAFQAGNSADAAQYLRVANSSAPAPATAEQADYLGVFLAETDAAAGEEKVIERANEFIRHYPASTLLPEVRMKLGQIHFHAGNFAGAETQFATLAKESPASPYAETALFLAGQSAMRSITPAAVDRALQLFDDVVKRDGPLKLYARQQQAIVQAKLGKEGEAVTLYDAILSAQPPPEPELRYASLAGKGENLLVLGRKDKTQLGAALGVFEQLAALPDLPAAWRNQALYKKATVLDLLERPADALAALYDVLDQERTAPREFFWYYKAGFDLADRFEQQSNWKSAIGIYEKMARIEGPRADDATARAKGLRLKHFIWE